MHKKLKIFMSCLLMLFSGLTLWAQEEQDMLTEMVLILPQPDGQAEYVDYDPGIAELAQIGEAANGLDPEFEPLPYYTEPFQPPPPALWDAMVSLDEGGDGERFRLPNRAFEIVIGAGAHISNDVVGGLFLNDVLEIDLQDIVDGFRFNFGANVAPLSMNVNIRDRFGFGLDLGHVTMSGNMSFPGSVLNFRETEEDLFGVGAAAFVEVGVPVFFHVREFRVRVRPALFTTIFHTRPGVVYSFGEVRSQDGRVLGQRLELAYDMYFLSAFDLEELLGDYGGGNITGLSARAFGLDIGLDVQYPLLPWLSVGLSITNLPFIPSNLEHFARLSGNIFLDTSYLDFGGIMNEETGLLDDAFGSTMEDLYFGTRANRIRRPFTMLFYAEARPFDRLQLITFIPSLGFSVNNLFPRPFALEGGLSTRFDLANMLFATAGINYNDRRWRNSLDFGFNLRVFELGLGISSQSPSFVGSFTGAGIGLDLALKFGW